MVWEFPVSKWILTGSIPRSCFSAGLCFVSSAIVVKRPLNRRPPVYIGPPKIASCCGDIYIPCDVTLPYMDCGTCEYPRDAIWLVGILIERPWHTLWVFSIMLHNTDQTGSMREQSCQVGKERTKQGVNLAHCPHMPNACAAGRRQLWTVSISWSFMGADLPVLYVVGTSCGVFVLNAAHNCPVPGCGTNKIHVGT